MRHDDKSSHTVIAGEVPIGDEERRPCISADSDKPTASERIRAENDEKRRAKREAAMRSLAEKSAVLGDNALLTDAETDVAIGAGFGWRTKDRLRPVPRLTPIPFGRSQRTQLGEVRDMVKVLAWAHETIMMLPSLPVSDLANWNKANSDRLIRLNRYDADLHKDLLAAVAARTDSGSRSRVT